MVNIKWNYSGMTMRNTNHKIFIVVFLSSTLLFSAVASIPPAEAKRSHGTPVLETNSQLVCGDVLCMTPMSISEKIGRYLFPYTEESQSTILQQGVAPQLMTDPKTMGVAEMSNQIPIAKFSSFKLFFENSVILSKKQMKEGFSIAKISKNNFIKSFINTQKFSEIHSIKKVPFVDAKKLNLLKTPFDSSEFLQDVYSKSTPKKIQMLKSDRTPDFSNTIIPKDVIAKFKLKAPSLSRIMPQR